MNIFSMSLQNVPYESKIHLKLEEASNKHNVDYLLGLGTSL
jgi:hypothetical protein